MIPLPPQANKRPVAIYDTECYPNFWLLKFKLESGIVYSFPIREGCRLSKQESETILTLFELFTTVSFNGNNYDIPMIIAALQGYTPEQLKILNDRIIPQQIKGQAKVYGAKPWELGLPEWKPADHIDIMEVAPGAGSLKQYCGRIHYKTIQDLPYTPSTVLTSEEIAVVDSYCENDLGGTEALFDELQPQLRQRDAVGKRYGLDLRSKSDAQMAETVLKHRCEQALGRRIYKNDIDWHMKFKCEVPSYIAFSMPHLQRALSIVQNATFGIRPPASMGLEGFEPGRCITMPEELEGLEIVIGHTTYKMGIGGLHSQEKRAVHIADDITVIRDIDVEAYYPTLMLNAGAWPTALGETFLVEFATIKNERVLAKALAKKLKAEGFEGTVEYEDASTEDGGGKIMINGTFGKTGSPYSILFAPKMLIQTTIPGQLSLLMLIEWHEHYGIPIVSANTDGIVVKCPRDKIHISEYLVKEWEARTNLKMETVQYLAIYSRDINNYFAIKEKWDETLKKWTGEVAEVKRKGEYSKGGLVEKKNPDVEICSDAVAEFLAHGTPIANTIYGCTDIRKFVTIQKVNGGGVKMWGEGPLKDALVRDIVPILEANGWVKDGRKWTKGANTADARTAYVSCVAPQRPEYLGKVVRWYYGTQSPGAIVYASNGNTVSLSYGAKPCMTLPDALPTDIDYNWYIKKADDMLKDVGYYTLS